MAVPKNTQTSPRPGGPSAVSTSGWGSVGAAGIGRLWLLAGASAVVLALVAALAFSGAAAARTLSDPGALTRWALPLAQSAQNLSAAAVIGALVFAAGILPPRLRPPRRGRDSADGDGGAEHPAFTRTMTLAGAAAIAWTLSAVAVLVLSFSDIAGQPLSADSSFTSALVGYVTDIATGRAWLAVTISAAIVATLVFGVRSVTELAATLVVAVVGGLVPLALIGHSASGNDHYGAVNSIGLHLLGVCLWVGGIIVLAVISGTLSSTDIAAQVLRRFSALAVFSFFLVFLSGVVNASIRITSLSQLATPYGVLLVVKALATLLLGLVGFLHRQWIIPRLPGRPAARVLWQLLTVELLIMGAVSGVAVALSRTAPPTPESLPVDASPARILTGYDLPPELTGARWFTEWRFDWLWVTIVLTAATTYILGMVKVRRRGDSWPLLRGLSWLVGLAALTYITSGPPSVYGMVLFSVHMVDHMALTMVVPLFLVLGAPVTLALKALTPRRDGSRGPREWILWLVHSKYSAFITHPLVAAANFAGSIIIFYYTPVFGFALREHVGHELMNVHFLLTGYLFVLSMVGQDPVPRRAPYPLRLVLLFATMAFHAFFGVAMTSSTSLIQASWFGNMGRDWGAGALADQQVGGAVMWGIGEIPTVLLAIGVAYMWSRSDARETKRKDRAADRNNDADLAAYNDMFATLARQDARLVPPGGPRPPRQPGDPDATAGRQATDKPSSIQGETS